MNAPSLNIAGQRQPQSVRTLLDTAHRYDAGVCGFDFPTEAGVDGGFRVVFDGRHSIPSVVITLSDEAVTGLQAMEALSDAILDALQMARRMAV